MKLKFKIHAFQTDAVKDILKRYTSALYSAKNLSATGASLR